MPLSSFPFTGRLLCAAFFAALLFLRASVPATALEPPGGTVPFKQGEHLTYRVFLDGINAGTIALTVLPMDTVDGRPARHFMLEGSTSPLLDRLYKLRQRMDAYVAPDMTRSLLARKWSRRGKKEKEVLISFDWEKTLAQYSSSKKRGAAAKGAPVPFSPADRHMAKRKKRAPIEVPPGTFDPLAALYHTRTVNMKTGDWCTLPVTNGKRWAMGRYRIGQRETVRLGKKEYDTFLIEPDTESVGNLFRKGKARKARIWVTADERRLPVKVRISLPLGSIVCELTSVGTREAR